MGEVYRARDAKLERDVAIKILPPTVAADTERLGRFEREARTLAALNHPNIAAIYGFEESGGVHALVMEYVPGPTLADRLVTGPLPVSEVLPIARQIADALQTAHDLGIVHRDLKPPNVKVTPDGVVKVLDFGLAKAIEPGTSGLSGGGRLHDLFVNFEAVTPGEYKAGGEGMRLSHGFATSPFGLIHAALSPRGLVHLAFVDGSDSGAATGLARRWPRAALERDDAAAQSLARQIFVTRRGRIALAPAGTNFQVRVWEALLELGAKGPTSYSALAAAIGSPGASRAVGQAVGANPVAWLIPCHRVLRRDGELGGYRWGVERKRAMLAWEYAASVTA
jgi:AraC family transcriptional regulator of adaptative response/methylated-DNA-[protein]-cysteine methyltransferase